MGNEQIWLCFLSRKQHVFKSKLNFYVKLSAAIQWNSLLIAFIPIKSRSSHAKVPFSYILHCSLPYQFSALFHPFTHEFCECVCNCFALFCPEIDFLKLSRHAARTGSRKCLLLWRGVNVMSWQTLPSDTWQGAPSLSGPLPRMCRRACVSALVFPVPLNVSLPPSMWLLAGRWTICTRGLWEESFRGLMKLSNSPNLNSAGNKNLKTAGQISLRKQEIKIKIISMVSIGTLCSLLHVWPEQDGEGYCGGSPRKMDEVYVFNRCVPPSLWETLLYPWNHPLTPFCPIHISCLSKRKGRKHLRPAGTTAPRPQVFSRLKNTYDWLSKSAFDWRAAG